VIHITFVFNKVSSVYIQFVLHQADHQSTDFKVNKMLAAKGLQRIRVGSINVSSLQNKANRILASISVTDSSSTGTLVMHDGPMAKFSTRLFSAPAAAYHQTVDVFPSILIGSDGSLSAQGPFAESQAQVSNFVS